MDTTRPTSTTDYATRLRSAGFGWQESATIALAATVRGLVPADPAPHDRADTAAGSGWSVLALLADGTAEPMARTEDYGTAADIAADAARLAESTTVHTAAGPVGWRVVVVPGRDEHAFCR